jgi:hypothetical protein
MDSQNEFQKNMMEMAAQHGALTPEVMQEMLRQQTAQKVVDGAGGESPSAPKMCCGTIISPGWIACPSCGSPIA